MRQEDDVFDKPVYDRLFKHLHTQARWRHDWRSTKEGPLNHLNYGIADFKGGKERKPEEPQLTDVFLDVWNVLKPVLPKDHVLIRCYANCILYGMEGLPHKDSNVREDLTTIIYVVKDWLPEYGGETMVYRRKEIEFAVLPKPNRLIQFPSVALHRVAPLGRLCFENPRITLMYKTGPEGALRDEDTDGTEGVDAPAAGEAA